MRPEPPDAGVDLDRANAARMYDYWLGGAHHFAVDREHAARIEAGNPAMVHAARSNRAYLGRVVSWCCARGIDQFLDLGSGVPTVGNVHEVAHGFDPDARVAYVDVEPVAAAHAAALLDEEPRVTVTRADLRDAEAVLRSPGVADLLDLTRPVALLAVAVLHFVPEPLDVVLAPYLDRLVAGSVVAFSHVSPDQDDPELADRIRAGAAAYRGSATEMTTRSRDQLRALVADLDVQAPGLVDVTDWPDPQPGVAPIGVYALVATVPDHGTP